MSYAMSGTAANGVDYAFMPGSATFPPWYQTISLPVEVIDDQQAEGTESVTLTLQPGPGYTIGNPSGTISITDDEGGGGGTPGQLDEAAPGPDCSSDPLADALHAGAAASPYSGHPIRYADGVVQMEATDLAAGGFGLPWGHTRSWTNWDGYADGYHQGNGWIDTHLPALVERDNGDRIVQVSNGTTARYFDLQMDGSYETQFYLRDTLAYDDVAGQFVLTDEAGQVFRFWDFDPSRPAAQRGRFISARDRFGHLTEVTAEDAEGKVLEVQRSGTEGGQAVTESYLYAYVGAGENAGLLEGVTLRRKVDAGAWATVRTVEYAYYGTSESFGNPGDLKTATVKDGRGTPWTRTTTATGSPARAAATKAG